MKSTEAYALLFEVWRDLHDVNVLWELAVIAASLALAWWVNRLLAPHFGRPEGKWAAGLGGLQRALFPLAALVLALIGRVVLGEFQKTPLLHVDDGPRHAGGHAQRGVLHIGRLLAEDREQLRGQPGRRDHRG